MRYEEAVGEHRSRTEGDDMIDESWYRRPPGVATHTAAGGVIIRPQENRLLVALIREGDLQGFVLPKGHVEPDESLEAAARREIAEETGLRGLASLGELAVRERLDHSKEEWKRTHYFLFVLRPSSAASPKSADASELVHWFPLDALPAMFWPEQRELLETYQDKIVELVHQERDIPPSGRH